MIRKSMLGKRMLSLLLCATLIFTSAAPTLASELTDTATVETQTEQQQVEESAIDSEIASEAEETEVTEDVSEDKDASAASEEADTVTDAVGEEAISSDDDLTITTLEEDTEGDKVGYYDALVDGKELQIGENPITATDYNTDDRIYYSFTPTESGWYCFTGARGVYGFTVDKYDNINNYVDIWRATQLTKGVTYYIYFEDKNYDTNSYTYPVTLHQLKSNKNVKISGNRENDGALLYRAFRDLTFEIKLMMEQPNLLNCMSLV